MQVISSTRLHQVVHHMGQAMLQGIGLTTHSKEMQHNTTDSVHPADVLSIEVRWWYRNAPAT